MAVTGYVYSLSYHRHDIGTWEDAYSYRNVCAKFVRYTIPFAMAYALELVAYAIADKALSFPQIVMIFLQGGIGPGSYYYPVMLQIVLFFPVIYFFIRKYDRKGLGFCWFLNVVYEVLQRAWLVSEGNYRLLAFRYIFIIAVGCYIAIGKTKIKRWHSIVTMLVGLVFIIVVNYTGYTPYVIINWTTTSFVGVMYIVPIVMFLFRRNLHCKALELLGKASYNIFLTQMAFYGIYPYVPSFFAENTAVHLVYNIVVCTVLGVLFYLIEDPITRNIKGWALKRKLW